MLYLSQILFVMSSDSFTVSVHANVYPSILGKNKKLSLYQYIYLTMIPGTKNN